MEGTMAEIRMFAGNFAPRTWAFCNGQILAISTNTALFSLLGTTYGGNGTNTFALPDFRGRVAVGTGSGGNSGFSVVLGEVGGSPSTTISQSQMPIHTHVASANIAIPFSADDGTSNEGSSATVFANAPAGVTIYSTNNPDSNLKPFNTNVTVNTAGSSTPISLLQPYLGMNYIICQFGIFPSRN